MEEEENEHQFEGEEKIYANVMPIGFRFRPTDKEIVADYLLRKIRGQDIPWTHPVVEVELSKYHPDGLSEKYAEEGKDDVWYFFVPRVKKYPNGGQTDRNAVNGYWKATEADKSIDIFLDGSMIRKITGLKKTLVFFNIDHADRDKKARKNKKEMKTAWTMYEYRIKDFMQSSPKTKFQDYALCKIYRSKRSKAKENNNLQPQQFEQPIQIASSEPDQHALVPFLSQHPEPSNLIPYPHAFSQPLPLAMAETPYPLTSSQPLPLAMAEALTEQPESSNYVPISDEFPEFFQDGYAIDPVISYSAPSPLDYMPFSVEFPELFQDGYSDDPMINSSAPLPGNERAVVRDQDLFGIFNCRTPTERLQGLPSIGDQKFDVAASYEHAMMEFTGYSMLSRPPCFESRI